MARRSIMRVLLSLVLLLSQHMAMTHAMTHWNGSASTASSGQSGAADKPLKASLHDQSCAQCLTYAQLGSAVGSPSQILFDVEADSSAPILPTVSAACARTVCVFQSRAPPQA